MAGRRENGRKGKGLFGRLATRAVLIGIGLAYIALPLFLGLFDTISEGEATTAGGFPERVEVGCVSESLGLWCTTRFDLKIARRRFSHTDVIGGLSPNSLAVHVARGNPVEVVYDRKACLGRRCGILAARHKDKVLVPFSRLPTRDTLLVWFVMISAGFCFWSAFRPMDRSGQARAS